MSGVFRNIDPLPPHRPASVYSPAFGAGGGHTRWVVRVWGVNSSEDSICKNFVQLTNHGELSTFLHGVSETKAQKTILLFFLNCSFLTWNRWWDQCRWIRYDRAGPYTRWCSPRSCAPRTRAGRCTWTQRSRNTQRTVLWTVEPLIHGLALGWQIYHHTPELEFLKSLWGLGTE
jgi:hypothetical protein